MSKTKLTTIEARVNFVDINDITSLFQSLRKLFKKFSYKSDLDSLGELGTNYGLVQNQRDMLVLFHVLNLGYQGINEPITYRDARGERRLMLKY